MPFPPRCVAVAAVLVVLQSIGPSSAIPTTAREATAASSLLPDLSGCATRQAKYGFFGKLETDADKECSDCTIVTYIAGEGANGDPEACAQYKDHVVTATSGSNKVNIPILAGVLPGAFDEVPAGVTWIDLGSSNAKYVNSTFSTLPSGIFNKVAERLIFLDMHTTAQNFTVLGPVEGLFGAPFPNLKRLKMDFDPKSPINGFGPEMFNENLANVSTFQVYFGNPSIPNDTFSHMAGLRQLNLISDVLTVLPPELLAKTTKLKALYLAGSYVYNSGNSGDGRYGPMPITELPPELFAATKNLDGFQVRGSNLTSIPENLFAKTPKLGLAMFLDSQLTALPEKLFAATPTLSTLYISGNSFSSLPAGLFDDVKSIVEMWFTPQSTGTTCEDLKLPSNVKCVV